MAKGATILVRTRRLWPFHIAVALGRVAVWIGGRRTRPYALRFVKRALLLGIYEVSSDGRHWRRTYPNPDRWLD